MGPQVLLLREAVEQLAILGDDPAQRRVAGHHTTGAVYPDRRAGYVLHGPTPPRVAWARSASCPRRSFPGLAGEAFVDLDVAGAGGGDDIGGHWRCGGALVPAGGAGPVPDELFVHGALAPAGLPFVGGPESG